MSLVTAAAAIGGLTFLLASLLIVANRLLKVEEDSRLNAVEAMLPGANCAACGFPGCRPFAQALVAGRAQPGLCSVSDASGRQAIADYLGVSAGDTARRVARLACAGGDNVARRSAQYQGEPSCLAQAQVSGGGKRCSWGCLGCGDCERSCSFAAIAMSAHALPQVDEDRCTACGDCVDACPRDLFSLQPAERRLWVACRNLERGEEVLQSCSVACTGCERCARDAAEGLITMRDNLPVIDYQGDHATREPIERCPTGAIVWINDAGQAVSGDAVRSAPRHSPLPVAPS